MPRLSLGLSTLNVMLLGENILKPPKIEVVGIFPPILKNKKIRNQRKRKGKKKESYIFIVYITFNIDW